MSKGKDRSRGLVITNVKGTPFLDSSDRSERIAKERGEKPLDIRIITDTLPVEIRGLIQNRKQVIKNNQ